ncbi:ALP_N domain-containing protein [Paraburkholderia sabiae]|jgi:plasmid segregation protein ParM|uniref:ParM/StbA family protein n=1 Tax=Paraburkholderia sabiae TaxID=273251 RepID=UPI001CAFFB05|nr:hypothetical protein [Paraburkholderia sabiae]CAG9233302.1 ALP_N domain-containing protein [Paraburkholderia sabiae]
MYIPALAVDVGHGFVKYAYRDASGQIHTGSFRSQALAHNESMLAASMRRVQTGSTVKTVTVDGRKFDVDVAENSPIRKSAGERNETNDFAGRPEYRALVHATFAHLNVTRVGSLVKGLPMHLFSQYAEDHQKTFQGTLSFGMRQVLVDRVQIVPQPVGSLLTLAAKRDATLEGATTCLIDVGHYSVDWLISQKFSIDYKRSGGRPGGASHVYRAMAEGLSAELGEPFEGIDQIELGLRTGTPVRAFGHPVDIRQFLKHANEQTLETARSIRAKVQSAEDLTLVLTGGGGHLYRDALSKVFPKNHLVELDQSRFTNVIGFLLYGEQHKS